MKYIHAALFIFVTLFLVAQADASQIKRVQRGTALFDLADVSQSVPLTYAVDTSKTIVLVSSTSVAVTADQNFFFTAQLADSQTVSIDRAGGTVAASVVWQVIEFESGVTVQSGVTTMQPTGASKKIKNISIATVSANALPIVQVRAAFTNATQTHELHLLPTFSDSSTLTLERKDATGTKGISVNWQVIDFLTDVTVQTGSVMIPASSSADDADNIDDTVTAVSNPILFTYFSGNYNVNGEDDREWATGEYIAGGPNVRFKGYNNTNTVGNDVYVQY